MVTEWSADRWRDLIEAAPDGIVVCEVQGAENPLVYANAAFVRLSGYGIEELIGRDLRLLQSWDRDQEARAQLRDAVALGEGCRVLLRNYRKDGTRFWNELQIQPVRSATGVVTHLIGFHRDVSDRERSALRRAPGLPSWMREDRLSGLCSPHYFEELLQHDLSDSVREQHALPLLAFDIDELGIYNETFGRAAGDACIRRVAGVVAAAFKRGSDVVARWDGGCILAIARSTDPARLEGFAAGIAQRVLDQRILNPRARRQRLLSVTYAITSTMPTRESTVDGCIQALLQAVRARKLEQTGLMAAEKSPGGSP